VDNLKTGLRDGIVLGRLLGGLWYKQLRYPMSSRIQQLHNVEQVFHQLESTGVHLHGITPEDILNGYREKTLELLWRCILAWKVNVLWGGNENELVKEVIRLGGNPEEVSMVFFYFLPFLLFFFIYFF